MHLLLVLAPTPNLAAWLSIGLAVGLVRDGRATTLVDTDPAAGLLTPMLGYGAASFSALLRGDPVKLTPLRLRLDGDPAPLSWLPSREALERSNTRWVAQGVAETSGLRERLCQLGAQGAADRVLVLCAPAGPNAGAATLFQLADAVLLVLPADEQAHAASVSFVADLQATRAQPTPLFVVAATAHAQDKPTGLHLRHWENEPDFCIPLGLNEAAPEWVQLAATWCERLHLLHPNLAERYRRAAESRDLNACEAAFRALRAADPESALTLFSEVCNHAGSPPEAAAGALLALAAEEPLHEPALRRVAGVAAQRLRLEVLTGLSQVVLEILELLVAGVPLHSQDAADAALLMHLAAVKLHVACWQQTKGQTLGTLPAQALELLGRASGMALKPSNQLRLAVVCGDHAKVTGSMATYGLARTALALAEQEMPSLVRGWDTLVLTRYAVVSDRKDIWDEVITRSNALMGFSPSNAHQQLAIAYAHSGQRGLALHHLGLAVVADPELMAELFADPDLKPLFVGAGDAAYDYNPPRNLQ